MQDTVLVTGGTGTLGRAVVARLRADGQSVRVLSRRPGPDTVVADLKTTAGLADAVASISAIIHCATDGRSDVMSTRNLITAAAGAGTPHLVYISIVGVDRHPLPYYRAKRVAEREIEASSLPWSILRATQFHSFVAALFAGQRWSPVVFAPTFSFQPVEVDEVAARLGEILAEGPQGHATDIGGPAIEKSRALAETYLAATHGRGKIVPLRLPGRTFAAYASGKHLTPEHRDGTVTFAQFMDATTSTGH